MFGRKTLMAVAAAALSLGGAQAASADDIFWKIGTRFPVGDGTVTIRVGGWEHDHRHRSHRCDSRCGHFERGHRCQGRCEHWRSSRRDCGWKGGHRCDDRCAHRDRGRAGSHDRRGRGDWKRGDDRDDRRDRQRGRNGRRR